MNVVRNDQSSSTHTSEVVVTETRFTVKDYGEDKPIATNETTEGTEFSRFHRWLWDPPLTP